MPAARSREYPTETKPRADVYTVLLGISLLALIIACVLVFLDWSQYKDAKPPKPSIQIPQRQTEPPPPAPPGP
jgi:hypothetical protein